MGNSFGNSVGVPQVRMELRDGLRERWDFGGFEAVASDTVAAADALALRRSRVQGLPPLNPRISALQLLLERFRHNAFQGRCASYQKALDCASVGVRQSQSLPV